VKPSGPLRLHPLFGLVPFVSVVLLVSGAVRARAIVSTAVPIVSAISGGSAHTCALTSTGGVECWGWNQVGQLGDGTTSDRSIPVVVVGLASGVAEVGAGYYHTCAVTTTGGVECWGSNQWGQLGDGTTVDRTTPGPVAGLGSGVVAVAGGFGHTCVLTSAGGVKCWGYNFAGQLGDGTRKNRTAPVDVVGLTSGVVAIAAGNSHNCALTSGGAVECWGYNGRGELGNGTTTNSPRPVPVSGLSSGVVAITAGQNHVCALTEGGAAECWGNNEWGGLGDGSGVDQWTPVDVVGLGSGVATISAGAAHTCAVTEKGAAMCWGFNREGEVGDGTTTNRYTPVAVSGLGSGVTGISAGFYHVCALTAGGVKCWGGNDSGQLGNGTTTQSTVPLDVIWSPVRIKVFVGPSVGAGTSFTVRAIAQGVDGKVMTGFNAPAAWSDLSGTLAPAKPRDFVNGISTTTATVAAPWHADRITVGSGDGSQESGPFNVLGPLASISVRMPGAANPAALSQPGEAPLAVSAGGSFTVRAVAYDAVGNPLTSYDGPASWSSLDGDLAPASPADFVNGVSTTSATIPAPYRNDRITVSTGGTTGESNLFNSLGSFSAIRLNFATPIRVGVPFALRANAVDVVGNTLLGYSGPATWSDLSGTLIPASPNAFSNGVSKTTATIRTVYSRDRVTLASGGLVRQSGRFDVR